MSVLIKGIIHKLKHRRFCKLNNYFCPDCIYHDFVFDGITFRGNRCRYPKEEANGERKDGGQEPPKEEANGS